MFDGDEHALELGLVGVLLVLLLKAFAQLAQDSNQLVMTRVATSVAAASAARIRKHGIEPSCDGKIQDKNEYNLW